MFSGSGANEETILHLGHVLPKIPLVDRKGSHEIIGYVRAFGYFSCAGKVPRQRQDTPIRPPISLQTNLLPRISQRGREHPPGRGDLLDRAAELL